MSTDQQCIRTVPASSHDGQCNLLDKSARTARRSADPIFAWQRCLCLRYPRTSVDGKNGDFKVLLGKTRIWEAVVVQDRVSYLGNRLELPHNRSANYHWNWVEYFRPRQFKSWSTYSNNCALVCPRHKAADRFVVNVRAHSAAPWQRKEVPGARLSVLRLPCQKLHCNRASPDQHVRSCGIFPSPSRTAASIPHHSCCTGGTDLSTSDTPESLWPWALSHWPASLAATGLFRLFSIPYCCSAGRWLPHQGHC